MVTGIFTAQSLKSYLLQFFCVFYNKTWLTIKATINLKAIWVGKSRFHDWVREVIKENQCKCKFHHFTD